MNWIGSSISDDNHSLFSWVPWFYFQDTHTNRKRKISVWLYHIVNWLLNYMWLILWALSLIIYCLYLFECLLLNVYYHWFEEAWNSQLTCLLSLNVCPFLWHCGVDSRLSIRYLCNQLSMSKGLVSQSLVLHLWETENPNLSITGGDSSRGGGDRYCIIIILLLANNSCHLCLMGVAQKLNHTNHVFLVRYYFFFLSVCMWKDHYISSKEALQAFLEILYLMGTRD